jgi:hypothetical protein
MEDTTIMTIVFCSVFGPVTLLFVTMFLKENLIMYHWFPRVFEKKGKLWTDYPYWIWVAVSALNAPLFIFMTWCWGIYTVLRVSWKILEVIPKIIYIGWAYKDGDAETQFKKVWPKLARVQKYNRDGCPLAPSYKTNGGSL